jgi:hypothetical protein
LLKLKTNFFSKNSILSQFLSQQRKKIGSSLSCNHRSCLSSKVGLWCRGGGSCGDKLSSGSTFSQSGLLPECAAEETAVAEGGDLSL